MEMEVGKTYKYRMPNYVSSGADYSFAQIKLSGELTLTEWQLKSKKGQFEETHGYKPEHEKWDDIEQQQSSLISYDTSDSNEETIQLIKKQCCLYFPVNRFEEPAWLNYDNLSTKLKYVNRSQIVNQTDRSVIQISPLKDNQNWLMDVVLDRELYEKNLIQQEGQVHPILAGYSGKSSQIYNLTLYLLQIITRIEGKSVRFGIGPRSRRSIELIRDEITWVPNIFQLSTGETQLLNFGLSIIRDYDFSEGTYTTLNDIKGIVIIDEIDAHLHTSHQTNVLPQLIKIFPNVQFIITTHSPLFLIGLEEALGPNGIQMIEMPTGLPISAYDHQEFANAYKIFMSTAHFRRDLQNELEKLAMPILFVEGDYDVSYIIRAAELLEKKEILDQFKVKFGDGEGNLTKIWQSYNTAVAEVLPNKVVLLYDCDISKPASERGLLYRRTMPIQQNHPLKKGIENLFSTETIEKVEASNPHFIDFTPALTTRVHGVTTEIPAVRTANKSEKKNLCSWLCEHGTPDDFAHFKTVFDILQEVLEK